MSLFITVEEGSKPRHFENPESVEFARHFDILTTVFATLSVSFKRVLDSVCDASNIATKTSQPPVMNRAVESQCGPRGISLHWAQDLQSRLPLLSTVLVMKHLTIRSKHRWTLGTCFDNALKSLKGATQQTGCCTTLSSLAGDNGPPSQLNQFLEICF